MNNWRFANDEQDRHRRYSNSMNSLFCEYSILEEFCILHGISVEDYIILTNANGYDFDFDYKNL